MPSGWLACGRNPASLAPRPPVRCGNRRPSTRPRGVPAHPATRPASLPPPAPFRWPPRKPPRRSLERRSHAASLLHFLLHRPPASELLRAPLLSPAGTQDAARAPWPGPSIHPAAPSLLFSLGG